LPEFRHYGVPLAPGVATALWQITERNPLFIREELRYLVDEERWTIRAGDSVNATEFLNLGLPQSVRDVIRLRLSRLTPVASDLMTVAAVIGREFDTATLQRANDVNDAELDAALDEAENGPHH
jgi:eukaryotic-like serine/threonine-protein kinase